MMPTLFNASMFELMHVIVGGITSDIRNNYTTAATAPLVAPDVLYFVLDGDDSAAAVPRQCTIQQFVNGGGDAAVPTTEANRHQ